MEHNNIIQHETVLSDDSHIQNRQTDSTSRSFIEANTVVSTVEEIRQRHMIPVFIKDNEPLISHSDFIQAMHSIAGDVFSGEQILSPAVRVSHPVKGRIPEAKDKSANQLSESEKTLYYERMAFIIELPGISEVIDGNQLTLTVGGVKSYNMDNLYSRSICEQHFKLFIGFQNKVCTNLCVWTDGAMLDVKVKSLAQLKACIYTLLQGYQQNYHLHHLQQLSRYSITERQFANLLGRCRMYHHLSSAMKSDIPSLHFNDTQVNSVCRDFYSDKSFCRDADGNINLWRLYNLFTGANKSSYIDQYVERSVNAYNLVEHIKSSLDQRAQSRYLN